MWHVYRHHWSREIKKLLIFHLSAYICSLCSGDVYRCESGRCRILPFFLIFLSQVVIEYFFPRTLRCTLVDFWFVIRRTQICKAFYFLINTIYHDVLVIECSYLSICDFCDNRIFFFIEWQSSISLSRVFSSPLCLQYVFAYCSLSI